MNRTGKSLYRHNLERGESWDLNQLRVTNANGGQSWNGQLFANMASRFNQAVSDVLSPSASVSSEGINSVLRVSPDVIDAFVTSTDSAEEGAENFNKAAYLSLLFHEFLNTHRLIQRLSALPSPAYWCYVRLTAAFNALGIQVISQSSAQRAANNNSVETSPTARKFVIPLSDKRLTSRLADQMSFGDLGRLYVSIGILNDLLRLDSSSNRTVPFHHVWFPISVHRDLSISLRETGPFGYVNIVINGKTVRRMRAITPTQDVAEYTRDGRTFCTGRTSLRFENPYLRHALCYLHDIGAYKAGQTCLLSDPEFDRKGHENESDSKGREYQSILNDFGRRQLWLQTYTTTLSNRIRYTNQQAKPVAVLILEPNQHASKWINWIRSNQGYNTEAWLEYFAGNLGQLKQPSKKDRSLTLAQSLTRKVEVMRPLVSYSSSLKSLFK